MSVVIKTVKGNSYAYLAYRSGRKVVHKYIGRMSDPATRKRVEELVSQKAVPQRHRWLFWDIDPLKIDLKANSRYVIERALETGGFEEILWIQKVYPANLIMETCETSRKVSQKSKNFWRVWFDEGAH